MNTNPYTKGYGYAQCRLLGHAWHHVPSDWQPMPGCGAMTVRCEHCNMERRDSISRNSGDLISRRYTYPVGYQFKGLEAEDQVRPTRSDWRVAWLDNELNQARELRKAQRAASQTDHPSSSARAAGRRAS